MNAKHTPGPWAIFPGNYHASFVVPEADLDKRLGGASDSAEDLADFAQEVCVIDRHHRHRSVEEQLANARLIAASPELLESIRDLLGAMDMQEKRDAGEFHIPQATALGIWRDAQFFARATIAKATGVAQ